MSANLNTLLDHLRRSAKAPPAPGTSDAVLLDRFVRARDQASFEVLVWRHGPMVWKVCKRVVGHKQDAEDAFQATFVVLARKAVTIVTRPVLAGWLYKVAYRVALAARQAAVRRAAREIAPMIDEPVQLDVNGQPPDVWPVVDEEINRLPEKYRTAVVLCCLQGKTHEEAAQLLGCPTGTMSVRVMRARERLRSRLTQRGIMLPAAALTAALATASADASMPTALAYAAVGTVAALGPSGPAASGSIFTLSEGVLRSMFLNKLRITLATMAAFCLIGTGVAAWTLRGRPVEAASDNASGDSGSSSAAELDLVKVPCLRDGVLVFIGTPVKPGEKLPGKQTATATVGQKKITYRTVHKADHVEAGQLLAQLDDRVARNELEIFESKVKAAQAEVEASDATAQEARVRVRRQEKLLQTASTSKEDFEAARLVWLRYESEAIAKKAELDTARLSVKKAELDLELYEVRSPVSGVIKSINKHAGEAVKQFETVFEIEPTADR